MVQYTYTKQVQSERLMDEVFAAGLTGVHHIDTSGTAVLIYFQGGLSAPQKATLDTVVANHQLTTTKEMVQTIIFNAIAFGSQLTKDFVTDNVMLGITQRGLTGHVRRMFREIKDCMDTGSLYDAVTEIKNLDPDGFDNVIVTPARVLAFRNKIETYLNVPLAQNWDDDETWL